jgi:hypothetical protein
VAIIPANLFITWLGATAGMTLHAAAGTARPRHPLEYVFLLAGLACALVALLYVTRIARAALARRGTGLPTK